jgi:hypothetical protein
MKTASKSASSLQKLSKLDLQSFLEKRQITISGNEYPVIMDKKLADELRNPSGRGDLVQKLEDAIAGIRLGEMTDWTPHFDFCFVDGKITVRTIMCYPFNLRVFLNPPTKIKVSGSEYAVVMNAPLREKLREAFESGDTESDIVRKLKNEIFNIRMNGASDRVRCIWITLSSNGEIESEDELRDPDGFGDDSDSQDASHAMTIWPTIEPISSIVEQAIPSSTALAPVATEGSLFSCCNLF